MMYQHRNLKEILTLSIFFITIFISSVRSVTVPKDNQKEVAKIDKLYKDYELIGIHESSKPLKCHGINQSQTIAPESLVVAVYFNKDVVELKIETGAFKENNTKQSQEFELDQPKPTNGSESASSTTSQPNIETSSLLPSISSVSPSIEPATASITPSTESSNLITTTTTTITEPAVNISDEQPPVASLTTRKGAAVHCGEANPNGKSNKKLVLDRIVGGRKTEPGEFPFQVRLNIRSRRGSGICGGVILNERYILTAAHCMTACVSQYLTTATIETSGVHATIGDHSIKSNDGEVEIDIEKIIPHEKYDACNFYANDHDIALIKTASPIEYRFTSDGYGSINRPCMPSKDIEYKDGEPVIVSGWGVTKQNSGSLSNILRFVQVPVVNVLKCQETYGSRITNNHVCAGYQAGGKDSCQGDSGGPLVRVVDNKYELVGIVSFGYGCAEPSAPGAYTKVASYLDWIQNNINT